jgi:hypothetical protein
MNRFKSHLSIGLLPLFLLLGAANTYAQTTTWTGSISTDWNVAGNWDNGVPGSGSTAIITNFSNKPILNTTTTIKNLQLGSDWPGAGITYLTVITGGSLTITNQLKFDGNGGSLHIDGGTVNHTGTSVSWGSNVNRYIEMTGGSFTTNANFEIEGGNNTSQAGFSVGNGTATFNGDLTVNSSSKWFDAGSGTISVAGNLEVGSGSKFELGTADLTITGTTTINGTFYGDDGTATFDGTTDIMSGGVLNLDTGTLIFDAKLNVKSNGAANLGSGTVNINADVEVKSSGYFNVEDATVNINGDADFSSNGNLSVDTGSINVGGNASISSGGSMSLGGGDLNLQGDLTVINGSDFQADSSTVTFSGDSTQTINTGGNDITFNHVVVDSGATFQTDGDSENIVTIEGDLTVHDGGNVNVQDDDQIDIQGDISGDGADNVQSPAPFVISAVATDVNTVVITFNKGMKEPAAETASNYDIERFSNGTPVTVNSATLNTGGDSTKVTLSISTILEDVEYQITIHGLESNDGGELSTSHKKRFKKVGPITFYSVTSGPWASASTWSKTSHSGTPSTTDHPGNTNNATIYVGDGDVVTISNATSITGQTAVEVKSASTLRVGSGGVLTTGTKTITGAGTFEVTSGTLKIGSPNGITSSGATGNIQTTTRTFGSAGSYTYNGSSAQQTGNGLPATVQNLTVDNTAGVTLTGTGIKVSGTLYLTNGTFIIGSGKDLLANTKSITSGKLKAERTISGSKGWRLLSSPINTSYSDLLSGTVTQGYPGAYYSTGSSPGDTLQPNVLYYDETHPGTDNQRWRAPTNASTSIPAGQGIFTYFFGDIDADPNYNNVFPLPLTLSAEGQEHEGPINLGVTYTMAADSGWNLVGNPYAATIDWDSPHWTKTNMDQSIYIWDYSSNQFLTWNGTTGDLGSGLISPFQGFWVKANGVSPELTVDEDAKTTGGTFVGKANSTNWEDIPTFTLSLVDEHRNEVTTHFMFSKSASRTKDSMDAYRLNPYSGINNYIELSSLSENGEKYAINNLPRRFGIPIEIPLNIEVYEHGYSASGNMYLKFLQSNEIPKDWVISLVDRKEGKEINLQNQPTYIFRHQGVKGKAAPNLSVTSSPKIQSKANAKNARFILRIEPGADAITLPKQFKLEQNYPNPFNPSTNIRFSLPLKNDVQLTIYDILGRKIATLVDKTLPAGTHTFNWDASRFASGIYLYRLVTQEWATTKKMTLIK